MLNILNDILCKDPPFQGLKKPSMRKIAWELFFNPGYRVVVYYRLSQSIKKSNFLPIQIKNFLSMSIIIRLCRVPGVEIRTKLEIMGGLHLPHPHGIVIGKGVKIGRNVTIYNGVTLGAKSIKEEEIEKETDQRYPVISDNSVIFSGAKILGSIMIGENSIIGANAVVLDSFPENSRIAGVPARLLNK